MSEKLIATKFLRDEAQIKQDWLCLLMKDESAPLDVTYKANLLKIQKEYYPFAIFDITCEAKWQATSYWEHTEKYQVPKEKTVYIDYQGKEHSTSGSDYEVCNGISYQHYRQPMSKTVYVTRTKVVIDNVETTSGYVPPTRYSEKIWTGEGRSLLDWTTRFNDSQMIEISQDYLRDYVLIPEEITRKDAESQAISKGREDIGNTASHDVPGDRYEDMRMSSNVLEVNRTSLLLGVYHIFYEYEGENYECLMSGGDETEDFILDDYPVDSSIKNRQNTIKKEIDKNSNDTSYVLGAVALSIVAFLLFCSVDYANWLIVVIPGIVFCIYKVRLLKTRRIRAEAEKENLDTSNTYLKQQIYELIQNDSIPEEEKKETIEGWIRENERNWQVVDEEKSNI